MGGKVASPPTYEDGLDANLSETSTGAAKQSWSTSSLGGSWALAKKDNLISTVYTNANVVPRTAVSRYTHPTSNGANPQRPYDPPPESARYLSATLLPN